MGQEFELKYRANPAVFEAVREKFGGFSQLSMETAYYDTPSGALRGRKWMLRRRLENGVSVCTLKTPLPDGSRGEWEVTAETIEAGLPRLCKLDVPGELASLTQQGLVQTCAAKFTRLAAAVALEGCTVELALDRGCFLAGERSAPFCELEVELKEGSREAAVEFAQALGREFGLEPEEKSKAQRAFALAAERN